MFIIYVKGMDNFNILYDLIAVMQVKLNSFRLHETTIDKHSAKYKN